MFDHAHYASICPHLIASDQSAVLTASLGCVPSPPSEPSAPSAPRGSYTNSNELMSDAQFCSNRNVLRNNAVRKTTLEGCGVEQELRVLLQTGFPLFRTDKIPWLFQHFLPFFQYFFNVLFENLIHFTKKYTVHLNITKNIKQYLSQFISVFQYFVWFSLTFSWLFQSV